jgi:broad-specificity NMP kinase
LQQINQPILQEIPKKQEQDNNKYNENLDTEISDDVDNENFEDFKIFESKKNVEINQKKSKKKIGREMGEEEINEIFENLCDMCGKCAGKRLRGEEVIKVLVSFNGDVQRTIKFFEGRMKCNTFAN